MNMITRNYYPVSGQPTQGINPQADNSPPPQVTSGNGSKLVDFAPPQQATGLQSSFNGLGSRAQTPATNAASGATENPVELLLNKLVEAIRTILRICFPDHKGISRTARHRHLRRLNGNRRRPPFSLHQPLFRVAVIVRQHRKAVRGEKRLSDRQTGLAAKERHSSAV